MKKKTKKKKKKKKKTYTWHPLNDKWTQPMYKDVKVRWAYLG